VGMNRVCGFLATLGDGILLGIKIWIGSNSPTRDGATGTLVAFAGFRVRLTGTRVGLTGFRVRKTGDLVGDFIGVIAFGFLDCSCLMF
jgi:hypothetical protein